MKKITLIIVLISTALNAQIGNTYESATLNLKNDEVVTGEVKIFQDGTIKFRKNDKSEKIVYTYRDVNKLDIYKDGINEVYKYKIIAGKKPKLMKVIKEYPNKINLYAMSNTVSYNPELGGSFFYYYYVNKGNGDVVIELGSSQPIYGGPYFKRTALEFFHDCPSLLKKIEDKEFNHRKNIEEIIEYYNNECK